MPVGVVTELVEGDVYHWGSLMAGALLGSLPVAVLYSFFVEYYVVGADRRRQGVASGLEPGTRRPHAGRMSATALRSEPHETSRTGFASRSRPTRVVLYMKGTPQFPQCGFSATVAEILKRCGVDDYFAVNVLDDPEIRQGIKEYANWPTIPQLYVNGEFVGGCDILREMYASGELQQVLKSQNGLTDTGIRRCVSSASRGAYGANGRHHNIPARLRAASRREAQWNTLKAGSDTLFILLGAIMVLAMHAGFAFLELGTVRKKNQVNALVQDPGRLRGLDDRVLLHRLRDRLRRHVLHRAPSARAEERLRAGQVLLPADVRRGDSGDRVRRHRRAREVQSAARRDVPAGRLRLSVLRRHRVEPALRHPGLDQGARSARSSTTSPAASSCTRWAAGSALVAVLLLGARRGRYSQGRRHRGASAVVDSVPRARRVGAVGRLVRLQRDVARRRSTRSPASSR